MLTDGGSEHFGWYWFEHLFPGKYKVCEQQQSGWEQSYPLNEDDNCHILNLPDDNSNHLTESINAVAGPEYNFGNKYVPPRLTIAKYNNRWPNTVSNGDDIEYTLTLKVLDNKMKDVTVLDLPPYGFTYISGSYKVKVNGIDRAIAEPVYHSPGFWYLGDLNKDDVVTMTYLADISGSVDPGLYKDMAWAYGCVSSTDCSLNSEDMLLASSVDSTKVDPGILTDNYVGTKIKLTTGFSSSQDVDIEKEEVGEVLGASIGGLPATGSETIWLVISGILLTLGAGLIYFSSKSRRKYLKLLLTLIFTFTTSLYLITGSALAASSSLFARIEEPISPTRNDNFKISFTAMDMLDRAITVRCYKVNPNGSEVQLGSDIALAAGGNSGECSLENSKLNENGKTYHFYVIAYAGGEEYKSESVAVDYDNSAPGTPSDYKKEKVADCQYKISFKTSTDGNTSKVEVYRSEKTEFTANGDTRVGEVGIGTDQKGDYVDITPDCYKTYYYVIRAFDESGNGSGITGDSVTVFISTTTTETTTTTTSGIGGQGAIPVSGANIPKEETVDLSKEQTGDATTGEGTVLGEKEGSLVSPAPSPTTTATSTQSKSKLPYILGAAGLGAIIWYGFRKSRQSEE